MDSYNLKSSCGSFSASIKRFLALFMAFSMAVYPLHSIAQDPAVVGREAQSHGKDLVEEYNNNPPSFDPSSGVMTLPNATINVNELFPGTSSTSGHTMDQFLPADSTIDIEKLKGISDDGEDMDELGLHNRASLFDDANSPDPTTTGAAYKVMIDMSNRSRPDLSDDPVFNLTKDIFANIDEISAEFGDCTQNTTFSEITNTERIPDYKTCERVVDRTTACEVDHIYDAGILKHHSGPYNILPLDNDSINVWIGRIGDNYWGGSCAIYEQVNEFVVVNPDAIRKVTLTYAKWDDYMQIWIGKAGQEQKVWSGPNNNFPPETAGACELSTSWVRNPGTDITQAFLDSISEGDIVRFKIRVSVTGGGEGFARLQIDYDPEKVVVQDIWTPQECIDAAEGFYDGFASGSVTCTSIPNQAAQTGCMTINEVQICNDDLDPSPFPNIPELCEKVYVDVDYDFFKGEYCFTNAQGIETCVQGGTGSRDTCQAYEDDPQCGYIKQSCLDGAQAADGTCYVFEEVWDCGEDVAVDDIESNTEIECAGPIRCMGADCLDPELTQSDSFAQTAALLNAAQFMTQDMNCVEVDGTQDVTCEVFGGEHHECKIAVGGVQDCCDVPTNTSVGTYINAMFQIAKLDTGLMSLENGNAVKSAYQTFREPIAKTISNVTEPFTSYAENISGSTSQLFEPVTQFIDGIKQEIKDAIVNTINDMLGEAATNMGADAATAAAADQAVDQAAQETAGEAIVENIAGAANVLMTVYTAYVVAVMVIQILYECEEDEFTLAAKKDTKSCTHVGSYCADEILGACVEKRESYCCFNSPLSRIINEQLRPQLSRAFGDPENPDCGGLEMTEVASIDWSQVDLSEWTALLSKHDLMPKADMNIASLTGASSDLDVFSNPRPDAEQRALDRIDPSDIDEIRREAAGNQTVDAEGTACVIEGCKEYVTETVPANVSHTYSCPSGYAMNGSQCTRQVASNYSATATYAGLQCAPPWRDWFEYNGNKYCVQGPNPIQWGHPDFQWSLATPYYTYSCPNGGNLSGTTCLRTVTETVPRIETDVYSCDAGWDLNGTNCERVVLQ